jgi:phospholipid/cholesterol/gamma-HCH transport system substrate-binding protein
MPLLRRQGGKKRIRRTDRRGMSPVTFGAIALVVLIIITYFGFTKAIPFTHQFRLNAVFQNANSLRTGSQVRIAGVTVGKVTKVSRYKNSDASVVQMEIKDTGLPIHKDATAKIRPRIFLEGNFFVDLKPGSPSTPKLEDDDAPLATTQTAAPVQFTDVLTTLQRDPREDLSQVLINLGKALNGKPTAAQDAQADPDAKGETAAKSLNDSAAYSADALRNASIINNAALGLEPDDLSRLIGGLQRVSAALDRNEGSLQGLVVNFNRTVATLADEQGNLRSTIRLLPPTLTQADSAFDALNRAFPPTRAFARDILPAVRLTPSTINASFPFIRQVRLLVSKPELRGLVAQLRPTTSDLAGLIDATVPLLDLVDPVNRCVIHNVLPTIKTPLQDGNLTSGIPNYKEFIQTLVAASAESQSFDGNSQMVRFQPGGGPTSISTGGSSLLGGPQLFSNALTQPLGTRPSYPGVRPPYRPDVACASQQRPNLSAAAGGAEARVMTRSTSSSNSSSPAATTRSGGTTADGAKDGKAGGR